jgi:hypothetical protein
LVVLVVELLSVDLLPFFLCFDFLVIVEPESVAVFWAKTTVPVKSESPRAAVMIFFIV